MSENLRLRVAAGTAIFRGNRLLLLHRSVGAANPGIWDLPGGQVHPGESLVQAARRETREETGLDVRVGPIFHAEVFGALSKRGKMRRSVGVYFHSHAPARKSLRLDPEEHCEYAWVSIRELSDYPTVPFLARTIRAAFRTRPSRAFGRNTRSAPAFSEFGTDPLPVPA